MVSYYKDTGAKAIKEYGIQQDTIADQINFTMHKNKALLIPAFIALLRDEYGFIIEGEMALEQEIPDIMTSLELCEEDKKELINAGETAPTLDEAKLMRQNGYKDRQGKMGCAYTLWCDHFNIKNITDDDAELICTPSKLTSVKKAEELINKTVELALSGDTVALRLCVERLVPKITDRPATVIMPDIIEAEATKIIPELLKSLAGQELSVSDMKSLMDIFTAHDDEVHKENKRHEKLEITTKDPIEAARQYQEIMRRSRA